VIKYDSVRFLALQPSQTLVGKKRPAKVVAVAEVPVGGQSHMPPRRSDHEVNGEGQVLTDEGLGLILLVELANENGSSGTHLSRPAFLPEIGVFLWQKGEYPIFVEPANGDPERIQVWGTFVIAEGERGNNYRSPEKGYLYFKLPEKKAEVAQKEWADLKAMAGKNEVVGFSSRYGAPAKVREALDAKVS
jgi:hypothetical protein